MLLCSLLCITYDWMIVSFEKSSVSIIRTESHLTKIAKIFVSFSFSCVSFCYLLSLQPNCMHLGYDEK